MLRHPDFAADGLHTLFVDQHLAALLADAQGAQPALHFTAAAAAGPAAAPRLAGARVDANDPLAVLTHGKRELRPAGPAPDAGAGLADLDHGPDGTVPMAVLINTTQADSLVMGLARVNGHLFADERARVAVVAYDYTVMAGTQGRKCHEKKDRIFKLAKQWRLPLVLFAEGSGGRGSDTDAYAVGVLRLDTFQRFAWLSGLVPLVGTCSGRCFAGNAVLPGCCDVVIATADSSIGMGGPAMIEGGGLGAYKLLAGLRAMPATPPRSGKKRPFVDTW